MDLGFILKKTITFFVEPFGMVLTLLTIGIYFLYTNRNRYAKLFISLGFFILLLFSNPPFSNYLVEKLEGKHPKYGYQENIKYIHVLGSGHNTDKFQPLSSQVSSIKRAIEGIIIHKRIKGSKLIFTGFKGGTNISNAKMNEKLAIALGVKKENIIIGSLPKDTKEEAVFVKSIVEKKQFILVTSASHMPRAIKLFKSVDLSPIPAPTNFYKNEVKSYLGIPNIGSLEISRIAIHEYLGILWSKIKE